MLDFGHVLADMAFVAIGLVMVNSARRAWQMTPELTPLDEQPSESFFRGFYKPAKLSIVAAGPWFVSLGLFALAWQIESSSKSHLVRILVWIPYYLFLGCAIISGITYFVLFCTGRPRALVPPAYRETSGNFLTV